jgi:hypothetical protein
MYLWAVCLNMSGKDVHVGWIEGLQVVQPRGGTSAWEINMAVTPQQRAQCVIWYAKFSNVTRTVSFSTPVQLSPCPFTSGQCEMVQYVPGRWCDYVSHRRKSAWQEQGGRHSANHGSESTEVAAPLVSCEKRSIHYMVSLLHVYVPLTGNKVDSFLQRFHLFLWHLKRINLYMF